MAILASKFHADNKTLLPTLATEIDGLMGHASKYQLITALIPLPTPKKSTHSAWPDARLRSEISGSSRDTGYRRLLVLFSSGKHLTRAPSMVCVMATKEQEPFMSTSFASREV